jgi:hypothetical protein
VDLGRYAQAAQVVIAVPDSFQYQSTISWPIAGYQFGAYTVANQEGGNGLPFNTSDDPRAAVTASGSNVFGVPLFTPTKYAPGTTTPVVIASGVEARLIEAEADLRAGGSRWLMILDTLRTGVGLPPLTDPGIGTLPAGKSAFDVRLDLVMQERGYWLFLTGHRQGDLRRLVRNDHRPQQTVYPTGPYFGGQGAYGTDVTLPIPASERPNPLFHGCLNREA